MRHSILLIVLLIIISTQLKAQSYGLNNADPSLFSKYRIPETNLSSLYFGVQSSFNSQKSDNLYADPTYSSSNDNLTRNFNSSLSPSYYLLKETDDRVLKINTRISGAYNYNYSKQNSFRNYNNNLMVYNNYSKQVGFNLNLLFEGDYRNYIAATDLFYSFGSDFLLDIYDRKIDNDNINDNSYEGAKTQSYDFTIGIGWGKIRNVTPVVSAIRFQERLKQLNLINDDLNENTIEALAEQFSKSSYYLQVYDRSAKYFWQDIEKTLANSGVSLSGLNQYGSNYIREVPNEIRFSRNEGIITGLNLQLLYDNSFHSYNSSLNEQFFTLANAYLNYSHQLNLNSQLSFDISLSGGPNLIKNSLVKQEYMFNSLVSYYFELTDRIVASIVNNFALTFQNATIQRKTLSNNLKIGMDYFLEDKLALNASYQLAYRDKKLEFQKNTAANNYITLGLTYYIDRGFIYN